MMDTIPTSSSVRDLLRTNMAQTYAVTIEGEEKKVTIDAATAGILADVVVASFRQVGWHVVANEPLAVMRSELSAIRRDVEEAIESAEDRFERRMQGMSV